MLELETHSHKKGGRDWYLRSGESFEATGTCLVGSESTLLEQTTSGAGRNGAALNHFRLARPAIYQVEDTPVHGLKSAIAGESGRD